MTSETAATTQGGGQRVERVEVRWTATPGQTSPAGCSPAASRLLRIAWLLTGDGGRAEDLVQTALLHCWPRWSRLRKLGDIDAYVRKTMTNAYVSDRRRRWSSEMPTEQLPESSAPPVDVDDRGQLLAALARLPRGQRAVVVLRFAEDLSVEQTVTVLGCSAGTVKSQTSRALAALRVDEELLTEDSG